MKHLIQKGAWKAVLSLFVVVMLATFFVVACSKNEVIQSVENQAEAMLIPEDSEVIYSHLRREKGELSGELIFSLPPSAAVYSLSMDLPDFKVYQEVLDKTSNAELLKFTIGKQRNGRFPILKVEVPTVQEARSYAEIRIKQSPHRRLSELRASLKTSMSWDQAKKFFRKFQGESCAVAPKSLCIPFQYTSNGCYARAHYMRKLMADAGYDCKKIFNFAVSSIPLSVVNRNGNCIQWNYHVAPLVTIRGVGDRVLDPSLFDEPVSSQTWINKMKSNCGGWGIPSMIQRITSSDVFYGDYYTDTWYYDDDYFQTYQEMDKFSRLED